MTCRTLVFLLAFVLVVGIATSGIANDSRVDYTRDIKPMLKARCYSCHGALKQEADLRLDTGTWIRKGSSTRSAITTEPAHASVLMERVSAKDESERMPPDGQPLSAAQIDLLRAWIAQGATSPIEELSEEDTRRHWAFQVPVRPAVPVVLDSIDSIRNGFNPIDAFLAEERIAAGVQPMPTTDGATLFRRLTLDLIGIPPTADELQNFLGDESERAYETVVDKLLESPQHGERWARHWMDIWRYSDWYGRRAVPDVMNSYPMVWRWRDWIVRSVNQDKPYDRMIVEMLAADELSPGDEENIVATGYLVRSWFKWNYETWKKDLVEHTGKAFLGLTLNCAQCHDHKYDPISQEEYFRFRAFFEPLELRHDRVRGEPDPGPFVKYVYALSYGPIKSGRVSVFDENLAAETFMFSNGDARLRMEGKPPVTPSGPAVLGGSQLQASQIKLPITAAYPGMKEFVRDEERSKWKSAIASAQKQLAEARDALASEPAALREELQAAELSLTQARTEATRLLSAAAASTSTGTGDTKRTGRILEGSQSLVLDAKSGRRALSHSLPGLDPLSDSGTVSYLVQVVQDGHTNLQLGLDIAKGATGGYVAFEKGAIKTYTPGGFNEFVAGNYDVANGQNRFRVLMQLDIARNQFLLSVTSLEDGCLLVDAAPAALNGWRPQADGKRGLFLDCRPGTEAIYDDLRFDQPDGSSVIRFAFEQPRYEDGRDVTEALSEPDSAPWLTTNFCQAPATSLLTSDIMENLTVRAATARLTAARQALKIPVLSAAAAEARLDAAQIELTSLEQRIEADSVRYSTGVLTEDRRNEAAVKELIQAACQEERKAAVASAKANVASAESAAAIAEVKLAEATKQADQAAIDTSNKALQAAQKQRTAAATSLSTANAALSKELGEYTSLSPKYPQVTSGRRASLALWIASKDNPLTARVAVNHIWLRHFGQALVDSPHDFGRNGCRPTHPKLLDWLACELMDSGWSMKHIHRLIVSSQSYRMASMAPQSLKLNSSEVANASAIDPDNKTYWRFPASRMQAEVVRDSLLGLSGELDQTLGGHEIDHKQGMTSRRRSLYFLHHGEEKMEFLELFDAANACDCYTRTSSIQPQQALALINSELTKSLSRQLEKRIWTSANLMVSKPNEPNASSRFVRIAFLQVLNREPSEKELTAALKFLEQQASRLTEFDGASPGFVPAERARANLLHALMNHNDFVTIR